MSRDPVAQVIEKLTANFNLAPVQAKVLQQLAANGAAKLDSDKVEKLLILKGFSEKAAKNSTLVLSKLGEDTGSQKETANLYYKEITRLFLSEKLFLFELEHEAKSKQSPSDQFQFFFNQIPDLLNINNPEEKKIIQNKQILAAIYKQIKSLIIDPLKNVFVYPGYMKIDSFVKQSKLLGHYFIDLTAMLEKAGYINVNLKTNEIIFLVNKIEKESRNFYELLKRACSDVPQASDANLFVTISELIKNTMSVPSASPAYHVYLRMLEDNIIARLTDFNFTEKEPYSRELKEVFKESYLLLNYFNKSENSPSAKKDDRLTIYSQNLCKKVINLGTKDQLTTNEEVYYFEKALACFSCHPGPNLKFVNAYYRNKNRLRFDTFQKGLAKIYS